MTTVAAPATATHSSGEEGRPRLALAATILPIAILGSLIGLAVATHRHPPGVAAIGQILLFGTLVFTGNVLARNRPANPIGWLLLVVPTFVLAFTGSQVVITAFPFRHHFAIAVAFAAATEFFYYCFLFTLPTVLLVFPDGRLPSPRWRKVLVGYIVSAVIVVVVSVSWMLETAFSGHLHVDRQGNPTNSPGPVVTLLLLVFSVLCLVLALAWVVRRIGSYRHSTGAVRQQYRWLGLGAVSLIAALVVSNITPSGNSTTANIENIIVPIAAFPFPLTICIAVLRYRLYDIDRVVSRTVSYGVVTGILVGVYAGVVTLATRLLPFSSPVAVAASTLVAVALFTPLRRRVQKVVDRRFNRARYDAEATVEAFAARLREDVQLNAVRDGLVTVLGSTLEPSVVSVWLSSATSAPPA